MKQLSVIIILLILIAAGCDTPGVLDEEPSQTDTTPLLADTTDTLSTTDTIDCLTIAQAQALYNESDALPATVCGYIVGTVKGSFKSGCNFAPPFTVETNILLSDSIAPTDIYSCLPVELKKNSPARDSLNLVANPAMLGTKVIISGTLIKYFKVAGIKSVFAFSIAH